MDDGKSEGVAAWSVQLGVYRCYFSDKFSNSYSMNSIK